MTHQSHDAAPPTKVPNQIPSTQKGKEHKGDDGAGTASMTLRLPDHALLTRHGDTNLCRPTPFTNSGNQPALVSRTRSKPKQRSNVGPSLVLVKKSPFCFRVSSFTSLISPSPSARGRP